MIGVVDLYQWSLEMNAFSIHEHSAKSQLKLFDNARLAATNTFKESTSLCNTQYPHHTLLLIM